MPKLFTTTNNQRRNIFWIIRNNIIEFVYFYNPDKSTDENCAGYDFNKTVLYNMLERIFLMSTVSDYYVNLKNTKSQAFKNNLKEKKDFIAGAKHFIFWELYFGYF